MEKSKSIVLSDVENTNKKAVLTLNEKSGNVDGLLRLYNFSREIDGIATLGLYANQKVYKAGLTLKSNMLYEFFIDLQNIPDKFSCAVINFQNAQPKPILFGSSEGSSEETYGDIISEVAQDSSMRNVTSVLDKYDVNFDEEEKKEIEKEIDKSLCEQDCENCVYKKYFFENADKQKEQESAEKEKNLHTDAEILPFYNKLKAQIDTLFDKNPTEEYLQKLIPNSKWVKVDYEDEGEFYVFGLVYDENQNVRFVCYGVPAVFEETPPEDISGFPIWTPLDKNNEKGFGYWISYQDAKDGEPIKDVILSD